MLSYTCVDCDTLIADALHKLINNQTYVTYTTKIIH
jgi:hypothetical protein